MHNCKAALRAWGKEDEGYELQVRVPGINTITLLIVFLHWYSYG